jgi:type IV pilus assembly protein PilP
MRAVQYPLAVCVLVLLAACDDPVQVGAPPPAPGGGAAAAPAPVVAEAVDAGVDGATVVTYIDNDFVELGTANRDPFRDFVLSVVVEAPVGEVRDVKLRDVALDQMRLIAVITGVAVPYAMIIDPEGVGHVIVRGDFIGRQELVNTGGAEGHPIALYWRVDRIRDGEVVLTREDPLQPDQPPLMRSMALRDVSAETAAAQGARQGVLTNTGEAPAGSTTEVAAPAPGAPAAPLPPPRSPPTNRRTSTDGTSGSTPTAGTGTGTAASGSQTGTTGQTTTRPRSIFGTGISH